MANAMVQQSYSPIVMACVLLSCVRCAGLRSISGMGACTSIEPRVARKVSIHCMGQSFGRYAHCKATALTVFVTEAGSPVTTAWFLRMLQRTGKAAKLPFAVHCHMLRHACGCKLANDGHDTRSLAHYLGHRNLQSTARYTALAPDRFAKFWHD